MTDLTPEAHARQLVGIARRHGWVRSDGETLIYHTVMDE